MLHGQWVEDSDDVDINGHAVPGEHGVEDGAAAAAAAAAAAFVIDDEDEDQGAQFDIEGDEEVPSPIIEAAAEMPTLRIEEDEQDRPDGLPNGDPDGQQGEDQDDWNGYLMDCRASVFVAGVLHVIHNITKDFKKVTKHFPEHLLDLTHVCRLISRKHSKDRLVAQCFKDPPHRQHVDHIIEFNK